MFQSINMENHDYDYQMNLKITTKLQNISLYNNTNCDILPFCGNF